MQTSRAVAEGVLRELPRDECLARLAQHRRGHGQALAEGALRIKAQPLRIGHSDQEEIEGTGLRAELIDIALTNQALIHPTELLRDLSEFGQRDGVFVHPGCLL